MLGRLAVGAGLQRLGVGSLWRVGRAAVCGSCARAGRLGERARVAGRPKGEGAAVWVEVLVAGPNGRRKEAAGWAVAG